MQLLYGSSFSETFTVQSNCVTWSVFTQMRTGSAQSYSFSHIHCHKLEKADTKCHKAEQIKVQIYAHTPCKLYKMTIAQDIDITTFLTLQVLNVHRHLQVVEYS